MNKRKYYFYCEKYNDGFWDLLEGSYDWEYLINNYTDNGVPAIDVVDYLVMAFHVENYSNIDDAKLKCMKIIDTRNIKQLKKDENKNPGLLKKDVYNKYMKQIVTQIEVTNRQ